MRIDLNITAGGGSSLDLSLRGASYAVYASDLHFAATQIELNSLAYLDPARAGSVCVFSSEANVLAEGKCHVY